MCVSAVRIVNSVLYRSFDEGKNFGIHKLQRFIYLVTSEYMKRTGEPLLKEQFFVGEYGPELVSLTDQFRPFNGRYVKLTAKNCESVPMVFVGETNRTLKAVIDDVWSAVSCTSPESLNEILKSEGSAWERARSRKDRFLKDSDILEDRSYCEVLSI